MHGVPVEVLGHATQPRASAAMQQLWWTSGAATQQVQHAVTQKHQSHRGHWARHHVCIAACVPRMTVHAGGDTSRQARRWRHCPFTLRCLLNSDCHNHTLLEDRSRRSEAAGTVCLHTWLKMARSWLLNSLFFMNSDKAAVLGTGDTSSRRQVTRPSPASRQAGAGSKRVYLSKCCSCNNVFGCWRPATWKGRMQGGSS
jgi:hypothetical protein